MRINVLAFSTNGCATALRLKDVLKNEEVDLWCKTSSDTLGLPCVESSVKKWTETAFCECDAIVYIGAIGIAVRYIAPFVKSKDTDPAVVCMDEHGRWAIALLSGHIGGCNELTRRITDGMGAEAIITTATDLNGKFSVDTFATRNGMRISSLKIAKDVSARVLDERFVGFHSDIPIEGDFPDGIIVADGGEFGVCVSPDPDKRPFDRTLNLIPMDIALGVGCKRGTDPQKLKDFVLRELRKLGIAPQRVASVSSIDLKIDEVAVMQLARGLRVPFRFYTSDQLNSLEGDFSSSPFVKRFTEVDCVCERSAAMASGGINFLLRKTAEDGMTLAICRVDIEPRFS